MWAIRYDDGTWLTPSETTPETAPTDGILVILCDHPEYGPQLLWGADYYLWVEDRWVALYLHDLERHLRRIVPELKYGRTTGDSGMAAAMAEALKRQASWQ